jgi:hypothetical protein
MNEQIVVYVAGISAALLIAQQVLATLERRANRRHVERLERMLLAKTTGEYAAGERILGEAPPAEPPGSPKPSLHDDMWTVPTRS